MRKLLVLAVFLMAAICVNAQGLKLEEGTYQEALDKAKKENKLVFMECTAVW